MECAPMISSGQTFIAATALTPKKIKLQSRSDSASFNGCSSETVIRSKLRSACIQVGSEAALRTVADRPIWLRCTTGDTDRRCKSGCEESLIGGLSCASTCSATTRRSCISCLTRTAHRDLDPQRVRGLRPSAACGKVLRVDRHHAADHDAAGGRPVADIKLLRVGGVDRFALDRRDRRSVCVGASA